MRHDQTKDVENAAAFFYNGRSRGYVSLSADNLVSLNEQQFVDLVSQRADELKPLRHKSLPHSSSNLHSCSEQNPRIPQC